MFQDGSNGEPTYQCPECADAEACQRHALPTIIKETAFHGSIKSSGFGRPPIIAGPRPESIGELAHHRSTSDRVTSSAPIHFPPDNFKNPLTLFSKSFSSFPRDTCSLFYFGLILLGLLNLLERERSRRLLVSFLIPKVTGAQNSGQVARLM
ncbi:hypothetical protein H5410_014701 [Solanum commersonii]|uniref:Uncharacterized protein n=1 Tax=Solanum commersonii TaxID=4109 RepID=A0A9J5ZRL3_SOLCO|nr:hypothetical protein H5410_014701 [Solanum commersonii]